MTRSPSRVQLLLARLALGLTITFAVAGAIWHGLSGEVLARIWENILERPGGPMTFRFILQPVMAAAAALVDGTRDARIGRAAFIRTILTSPEERTERMHEALISTARIVLLGLAMDTIYQALVFETFHPGEAAIVALLLAFVPYVLLRGPFTRVAGWWFGSTARGRSPR
ncbi:hypothetical protein [Reyranella sp.]|uniref:hypothetical protein n=1 Tax=Reyranella sp. TaxID=1929291 RepID=UPI003BA8A78F